MGTSVGPGAMMRVCAPFLCQRASSGVVEGQSTGRVHGPRPEARLGQQHNRRQGPAPHGRRPGPPPKCGVSSAIDAPRRASGARFFSSARVAAM